MRKVEKVIILLLAILTILCLSGLSYDFALFFEGTSRGL